MLDNNLIPTYLPFTVIAHYNIDLKEVYFRASLAQWKIYIRSPTRSAREAFKINANEAFKQPFHLASFELPKR